MKFSISKYLSQKIRFTAKRAVTDEEILHLTISRISFAAILLAAVASVVVITIYLTLKTPLANYIPGFHGKEAQMKLVEALVKMDSLTDQVERWETYNNNLLLVLEGGNTMSQAVDSITKGEHHIAPRIVMDSLLRIRVRQDSINISKSKVSQRGIFEMIPPSSGMITSRFSPHEGLTGITIAPPPGGNILSVMDGTVISTFWEPETGWTIIIQHASGMISKYRHLASVLSGIGEKIRAGEVIGTASVLESGSAPKMVFELWYNGYLVDPEKYITF